MMADMHLKNLRQKMMIEKKMEETNKRLESTKVCTMAFSTIFSSAVVTLSELLWLCHLLLF